jgi:hypothetical protein
MSFKKYEKAFDIVWNRAREGKSLVYSYLFRWVMSFRNPADETALFPEYCHSISG